MKKIVKLLLLIGTFYNITGAEKPIVKKAPIIISDFDQVWIMPTGLVGALIHLEPIKGSFAARTDANKLNNFTLRFLDAGRNDLTLLPRIPQLIEYIGKSRRLNQPINKLYHHLRHKGSPIVIATNKDRMLYDYAIQTLGNEVTHKAEKVFVAELNSGKDAIEALREFANKPTVPKQYKDMVNRAISIQPTQKIFHVPSKKPHRAFFTYVIDHVGPDRDMIFIDDDIKNVNAFNALQEGCSYLRRGIVYNKNNPELFVQELIKLGLVSEVEDKKLLHDIRYPGKK